MGAAWQQWQNWQAVTGRGNEHLNQSVSKVKAKWIRSGCRSHGRHGVHDGGEVRDQLHDEHEARVEQHRRGRTPSKGRVYWRAGLRRVFLITPATPGYLSYYTIYFSVDKSPKSSSLEGATSVSLWLHELLYFFYRVVQLLLAWYI